jgi:hypothetical protein
MPTLKFTSAARSALHEQIQSIKEFQAVAAIMWTRGLVHQWRKPDGTTGVETSDPKWHVGYFSVSKLPREEIYYLEGIPFIFEECDIARLNGSTLDFSNGVFHVIESK